MSLTSMILFLSEGDELAKALLMMLHVMLRVASAMRDVTSTVSRASFFMGGMRKAIHEKWTKAVELVKRLFIMQSNGVGSLATLLFSFKNFDNGDCTRADVVTMIRKKPSLIVWQDLSE